MGYAEIISFTEVCASTQWAIFRQTLHKCFAQCLHRLEETLPVATPTVAKVMQVVWELRQQLTGRLTEDIIDSTYTDERT